MLSPGYSQMQSVVEKRAPFLPKIYQQNYAQPLLNNFAQFLSEIDSDPTFTETICAAVYQHAPDYVPARGYLNRFQAVCATLYDDFFNSEMRKDLNLPLIEKIPPLAMFQKASPLRLALLMLYAMMLIRCSCRAATQARSQSRPTQCSSSLADPSAWSPCPGPTAPTRCCGLPSPMRSAATTSFTPTLAC